MNTAIAAAAASTPTIKGGFNLDSFDVRLLEYQYSIWKLETLITHTRAISIRVKSNPDALIPLIHYIETFIGPLLNISDKLSKRLQSISKLEKSKDQRRLIPPVNTTALNFELEDTKAPEADYKAKQVDYVSLLNDLLSVLENALVIYQAKLKQTSTERESYRQSPLPLEHFKELLEPKELLSLLKFIVDKDSITSYQLKKSPVFLDALLKALQNVSQYLAKLKVFKTKASDGTLKKLPEWQYTMHRLLAVTIRLSDIHTILRKFGRELYLPVSSTLRSPKLLHNNLRLELSLRDCEDLFYKSKKNEQLVFTLARTTRQGSSFPLRTNTVVEFYNALAPTETLIIKSINALNELINNWEFAITRENTRKLKLDTSHKDKNDGSKVVKSPETRRLEVLFNPEKDKLSQETIAKQQREREKVALEERITKEKADKERQLVDDLKAKKKVEDRERQLRNELRKERTSPSVSRNGSLRVDPKVRSRSGSDASVSSTSSSSSVNLNSLRSDSLSSTGRPKNSPTVSRSPSLQRRPASVYISSPAFDIRTQLRRQEKEKKAATTAAAVSIASSPNTTNGRRRSSSLQSSLPSAERNNSVVTAAASAALKQERHSSLQSISEVKHRQFLQQKEDSLATPNKTTSKVKLTSRSPSPSKPSQASPASTSEIIPTFHNFSLDDIEEDYVKEGNGEEHHVSNDTSPSKAQIPKLNVETSTPPLKSALKSPDVDVPTTKDKDSTGDNSKRAVSDDSSGANSISNVVQSAEKISVEKQSNSNANSDETLADITNATVKSSGDSDPETIIVKPIVKKVRFTGVPDEVEEDPKPKRKGWIKPPKLRFTNNKPRSSISIAADALQQERVTFHNVKRGEFDMKTGKVVYPTNGRMTATLANSANSPNKSGKWKSLKDRFA